MKNLFSEYLDGIGAGDVIPSISGRIVKVIDPCEDNKNVQTIKIEDDDNVLLSIKVQASCHVKHPKVGNILHAASSPSGKSASIGLVYKISPRTGQTYISAGKGSLLSHTAEDSVTEFKDETEEPMTGSDYKLESLVLDRLHVYNRCMITVRKFNSDNLCPFPEEKVPELATSMHIEMMRAGIQPRPSDQQAKRKEVHKERADKKEAPPKKEEPKRSNVSDWRSKPHPTTGTLLGSETPEKIATVLWPWALRQNNIGGESKNSEYAGAILEAVKDLGMTVSEMFSAYVVKYATDEEPHSEKRRNAAIKKFEDYIDINGKKDYEIERMLIDKTFVKLWDKSQEE